MYCDIIKIKNMVRNKERFVKRRQRLIGPNGCTLKAIELVTGCYVLVQGNTVCGMGDIKGLKHLRQLVEACMKNTHPIYTIKKLMIQRELAKNPELKEESWERFLPKFQKRKPPKNKKKKKPIIKKEKTPFPPEQKPRKVDIELETGEYFLNQEQKKQKKQEERSKTNAVKRLQKQKEKAQEFIPPKEEKVKTKKSTEEEVVPRVQQPKSGREAKKQKEKEREETKTKKKRKREEKTTADSQPQQVSNKKTGTRTDASSDMLQTLKEKFKKQKKAEASKSQPSSASEYVLT